MEHISIILSGVNGKYDNVVYVMHARQNTYDLASISSILLNVKARLRDQLFDPSLC